MAAFAISQAAVDQSADGQVEGILLVDKHHGTLLLLAILQALSTVLLIGPLGYLYLATRYRRPEVPRILRGLVVGGPLLYAALFVARQVAINSIAADVVPQLPLPPSMAEDLIDDKITQGSFVVLSGLAFAGQIAVGGAIVLASMHARRSGLLSSFMGILGIIVGAFFVLPLLGPLPVVQFFWFAAIGVLFMGRWPADRGPAWETGEADPWPTAAEARAEAEGEAEDSRAARRGVPEPLADDDEEALGDYEEDVSDEPPGAPSHPRSTKRKRKRRR